MTKSHAANVRTRRAVSGEPLITINQFNAAIRERPNLHTMFIEELMIRISEEDFEAMRPSFLPLGRIFSESIGQCFYNAECENPLPQTFSELHERFLCGEKHLIPFLQSHGPGTVNEGAKTVLRRCIALCVIVLKLR